MAAKRPEKPDYVPTFDEIALSMRQRFNPRGVKSGRELLEGARTKEIGLMKQSGKNDHPYIAGLSKDDLDPATISVMLRELENRKKGETNTVWNYELNDPSFMKKLKKYLKD